MEPLSPSKSDGLLPQDLSKSSLPSALNLTRKSDDILLKSNSMEALRMVKTPSWYSIGPGSSKGLGFPESDSDHMPQSSQQVQPDNAFSNATVTLSYVSRSRVFSSHNPSICGLPSIHRKLSRHSPTHEADMLANEAGQGALHVDIDQCILQHAAKPVGLTSQSELFETSTQAHLMESIAGTCFVQQALEMNGNKDGHPLGVEKLEPKLGDNASECTHSQESDGSGCQHNCTGNSFSEVKEISTKSLLTNTGGEGKKCDSEVFFFISRTEEPVIFLDNVDSRNLCNSLNGEYISPLEDPLSPPATSLDETEVVFVLPQTLSSPTGDNSIDDVSNVTGQEEPVDLSVTEPQAAPPEVGYSLESSLGSNIVEVPIVSNGLRKLPADIPETCRPPSRSSNDLLDSKGISPEGQKAKSPVYDDPILNGSILAHKRAFQRKKLPPRSRRGKRLEAIVQNISPSRSKSSNVHSINKCTSPKSQTNFSHPVREVLQCQDSLEDASGPERESSLKTTLLQKVNADNTDTESHRSKNSTSDCEYISTFKSSYSNASPEPLTPKKTTENGQLGSSLKRSPRVRGKRTSLLPKACQKSPTKQHTTSGASKAMPTSKKAHITKRKRKKRKAGQSSLFSPQEPEIKLKYVNYKEEKRDMKADTFSPFIRMEVKEYSTCTVVNYAEEENTRLKKGQQQAPSGFVSGIIPTTSCLQLGRVSTESKCQNSLVCCLCSRSANAVDLGDLHGPYYPEGYKPAAKAQRSKQGLKEEEYSDSDSSFSARSRRRAQAHTSWPPRPAHRLKREDVLGSSHTLATDSEGLESPSSKRPRTELITDDWYSPPVVPLDTNEYWVHEDCGIWSAGVFLVKGKLYGLEEAVRLAQETVCSTCNRVGATLGCFFKGCPNKYHYPCAMQSDCVLNEDNFSMKCTKHKVGSLILTHQAIGLHVSEAVKEWKFIYKRCL
ncbi:retinoic acid-induced protein 1 isoform X1 [Scleropages formosus]|uniref:retinoic acid-induced protein 1 isoform X1 n=1 Tax=Scleropages formosus TaxID=113540 RepID=UPI0008785D01|nr:retinoic acid-induced protein 1-like isoform X1 [Scleropages formosus]